jgi:hypothetical protein
MQSVLDRLRGGDLRSKGAADEVARQAAENPSLVAEIVAGLKADEPVVRMRCADALEKVTRRRPEYLEHLRWHIREMLHPDQPKELLWHLVQMSPRVRWEREELAQVFEAVRTCLSSPSSIVKVSAMQALWALTHQAPERRGEVRELVAKLSRNGTPAMKARAAKLLREPAG